VDIQLEISGGRGGLLAADLGRPGTHIAFGQDDHSCPITVMLHLQQKRARPDLGIVWMGAERQEMKWLDHTSPLFVPARERASDR
jgi:hypothetical protein